MTFRLIDLTILLRALRIEMRGPFFPLQDWMKTIALFSSRARQRRQLSQLSEHALIDIGITHAEALAEANKPFWKS